MSSPDTDHRPRRTSVSDPIAVGRQYDYADAFEVRRSTPERHTPEHWVGVGLANIGGLVPLIVRLLGVRETGSSGDGLDGWRVVRSTPDVVHLEQSLPMMEVVFVGRNPEPTRRTLTTLITYRRPLLARVAWSLIGIMHRRAAKRILATEPATPPGAEG